MALEVLVPVTTEVIELNPACVIDGKSEDGRIIIRLDARKQDHRKRLGLCADTPIHFGSSRVIEVQELSGLGWPLCYEVTTADGWYVNEYGQRCWFTPELEGISLRRGVSWVVMRAAVLLAIIAGIGVRRAAWLLGILFHVTISKSSVDRWIGEVAQTLPSADELVKELNRRQPIGEGHLDELFANGGDKPCLLVFRDEHGRIVASEELKSRDEAHVKPFLHRLKGLGLAVRVFYIDHCKAYKNAIEAVYPEAVIQYDYFHIIQNIWRHLWRYFVSHRKQVKERSEKVKTPWYSAQLQQLATTLWKKRYLIFKAEENMTEEEKAQLASIMEVDLKVSRLRAFMQGVWDMFNQSQDEADAKRALEAIKEQAIEAKAKPTLEKIHTFLDDNFDQMITYLKIPGVQRNSLAETGMRTLRRLEQGHDGFRSPQGRQDALRIYQAVKYLGWTVHHPPDLFSVG